MAFNAKAITAKNLIAKMENDDNLVEFKEKKPAE